MILLKKFNRENTFTKSTLNKNIIKTYFKVISSTFYNDF